MNMSWLILAFLEALFHAKTSKILCLEVLLHLKYPQHTQETELKAVRLNKAFSQQVIVVKHQQLAHPETRDL